MTLPTLLRGRLRLPVIASPLFIISNPALVIAACKAGIVGSFNSQNARTPEELASWLTRIEHELAAALANQTAYPQFRAWQQAPDAAEGARAFTEKRPPAWVPHE